MKKLLNFLKRHAKKFALVSVVTVAAVGATAVAWGPDRPTYTVAHPSDHVTFDSITDNPNYGDERSFLDAKDAAITQSGGFKDLNQVKDGEEILVRTYVHNNAAANLNLVAENTKVRVQLPTGTTKNMRINSFISSSNATPNEVYDHTDLTGAGAFSLSYVPGSAIVYTNAVPNGMKASDGIVNDGALIGYDKLDGRVPGCFQYTALVTVKVKVKMSNPGQEIQKTVRKSGTTAWSEQVTAKPGDELEYRLRVANTGTVDNTNTLVGDNLPPHVTYVPGSTMKFDSNFPNGVKVNDGVTTGGLNIGTYAPGGVAYVTFKAKVADDLKDSCKTVKLTNVGVADSDQTNPIQDTADTTVAGKTCTTNTPAYECTSVDAIDLGGNKFQFKVNTNTSGGVTVNKYTYDFGDGSEAENSTSNTSQPHQFSASSTVTVRVLFNVGSEQKDATCTAQVTVPTNPEVPELPNTGIGGIVAGVFGTSALAYGGYAFASSRRALKNILK